MNDNVMTYGGYRAKIEYDRRNEIFVGHVLHLQDLVSFEGTSVETLRTAFQEAVDDYLAWCKEEGRNPQRVYSGNIPARLNPELHKEIAEIAAREGVSLNAWITGVLQAAADEAGRRRSALSTVDRP